MSKVKDLVLGTVEKYVVISYGPTGSCEVDAYKDIEITLQDLIEIFQRMDEKTRQYVLSVLLETITPESPHT